MFSLLKSAAKELLIYGALSALAFVANLALYVGYFLLAKPKYTFLTGNWLLAILLVLECAACFYFLCIRGAQGDERLARFRSACSYVATGILALYGLHATVFTIVERSVSVNVIRYLISAESQPYANIEQNFIDTFVYRDKAVCKRLDEQIHLGNITVDNDRYSVTPKGRRTYAVLEAAHAVTADTDPANSVTCR